MDPGRIAAVVTFSNYVLGISALLDNIHCWEVVCLCEVYEAISGIAYKTSNS